MKNNGVREKVVKILKKHPEGLTTIDIAEKVGMTRQAVIKYIYLLIGEGLIVQREVGTAKIFYLRCKHERK